MPVAVCISMLEIMRWCVERVERRESQSGQVRQDNAEIPLPIDWPKKVPPCPRPS